eukprot:CAMPEP_0195513398 /NCGR_PEP_ID=MMETSP0794_2-20130614/5054_1 /TAXON_ID=515487 /ORGANISM="Stephanopyxis turris, Strain CCMP 815" /LENGTH=344 /DNA_ID=CAMNT_0040641395 /DNA_START=42 /DNA_END=1076 /DNA_ORIENTATION=-
MVITVAPIPTALRQAQSLSSSSTGNTKFTNVYQQDSSAFQYSSNAYQQPANMSQYDNSSTDVTKSSMAGLVNSFDMKLWICFFGVVLFVHSLVCTGDFSALLVLASSARTFGFAVLNLKIWATKSVAGISVKTLHMYCLVFFCSGLSIWVDEGYMPNDEVGGFTYQMVEAISLFLALSAIYACTVQFRTTYQHDCDRFGEQNVPSGFGTLYLVIPSFILALIFHPERNDHFITDVAYAFSMYLEAVALLPQLYMFQKHVKQAVELLTAHFVFALGFGRAVEFFFWFQCYHLLENENGSHMVGYLSLFSQLMQIALMLDFFYYYYLSLKDGTPMVFSSRCGFDVV